MPEKIFDIQPKKPQVKPKLEEGKIPPQIKKPEFEISLLKIRYKKFFVLIPLILVAIGYLFYFTLPRAKIEIWPETEIKTFKTKVTLDQGIESPDFSAKLLPAKFSELEKTFSEEFPSTGKKLLEKKAQGIIRIYNDYNSPQVLVANTRFQAPLEKFQPPLEKGENPWFKTVERVAIPAKGQVEVKVVADGPGEKYNIEPSTFSIPGLAGTPQYTFLYGKSFEPMKGGMLAKISQVTPEDLDKAKEALTGKAKNEIENLLKLDIPAEFVFLERALETKILETFSSVKAGGETEKFNYQVRAYSATLLFKKEVLESFAKNFITLQISDSQKLYPPSLKIDYSPETVNLEVGKIILNLEMEVKIYSAIDEISLKEGLAGKSLAETQISLENQPLITKARVKLWPFWIKRTPEEIEKIEIKLNID